MISTVLNDQDGESIRLEFMGDGMLYLCQQVEGHAQCEHRITVTEKQLSRLIDLAIEWGMPFPDRQDV